MHNLPALVKGRNRCVLQISPHDADRMGLKDGNEARITSRVGSVVAPVEVTEDLMPGVVSLPHGWGHDVEGSRLTVAKARGGVNTNALTDDRAYDEGAYLRQIDYSHEPAPRLKENDAAWADALLRAKGLRS